MRLDKLVWVEQNQALTAIRIFKNRNAAFSTTVLVVEMRYKVAVGDIRHFCWLRSKGECELCGDIVTEQSGHLHEQWWRGKGGEISIWNSVFICAKTHKREHRSREPQWSRP